MNRVESQGPMPSQLNRKSIAALLIPTICRTVSILTLILVSPSVADENPPVDAPRFSLPSLDGRELTLSDYQGKYLLVNFWATWCGPCKVEMPSLELLYRKFKQRNFAMIAVSNVSKNIPHPVHDELHDRPYPPNAHGNAGWTKGDTEFLIYDRCDIWLTDPNGRKAPVNITEGVGRETETRFRYVSLDPEERARDPKADLLLSGFNLKTKAMGYYRDRIDSMDKPAELIARDKRFSNLQKAKDTDVLLFRQSSFEEYPDLWTSDLDFQNARKISEVNPQQKDYLWGTAELVEWVSLDGKPLQGILYKPDNFDPAQKYPLLVYFYEKMSHQLHGHRTPRASGSSINFPFYVSRGYLIFIPDIPYKVGFPGESAVNAVVPGVTHLINRGFVNPDRICRAGPQLGRLSNRLYDHPNQHISSSRGWRTRFKHGQCVRRHPMEFGTQPHDAIRKNPEPASAAHSGKRPRGLSKTHPFFGQTKFKRLCSSCTTTTTAQYPGTRASNSSLPCAAWANPHGWSITTEKHTAFANTTTAKIGASACNNSLTTTSKMPPHLYG